MGYHGCRPGWTPDAAAATREDNPVSREEQIKAAQAEWDADPENLDGAAARAAREEAAAIEETAPAEDEDEREATRYL